ncbi:uncharacterized protein LOC120347575 [Styela clava]
MSANAAAQSIPIRRIQVRHPSEIPLDYGTTPGGTMYSTTPGGTRIIYDRLFLLKCRDSPLSKTPPANLPDIPGVTTPDRSPAKHVIGKIPEEGRENGEQEGQRYRRPNFFQYPHPPVHDANNNTYLQVPPPSFPVQHNYRGPLAQYRRRQSISQMRQDCYLPHCAFNNFHPPPMDPQFRGIFSPPPGSMECPFTPPPIFVHPIQGPTGPVFDQRPMEQVSQLERWRRTHSINSSETTGYTTAKAPQLNSSFPSPNMECFPPRISTPASGYTTAQTPLLNSSFASSGGECSSPRMNFGRGRGFPRPHAPYPALNKVFNILQPTRNKSSRGDSAYDSSYSENDLVMVIPDDPSIIAYKPLEKQKVDGNSNYTPLFSPIPQLMGVKM